MLYSEAAQIKLDIADAIKEVASVSTGTSFTTNIIWYSRVHQDYDTLYRVDVNSAFVTHTLFGVFIKRVKEYELFLEGLNINEGSRVLVAPAQFSAVSIYPQIYDRMEHDGVIYSISKIYPIYVGGVLDIFRVDVKEAQIAAQTEEKREKDDPYYEIDASQEKWDTNTSGANTSIFTTDAAWFKGSRVEPFTIVGSTNDIIKIGIGTFAATTITLASDVYTASAFVASLQVLLDAAFGASAATAFTRDSKVGVQTVAVGSLGTIVIADVADSAYVDLGWRLGTYTGKYQIDLAPNSAYSDGDPLYNL